MLSTEIFFTDEDIFFKVTFDNSRFVNTSRYSEKKITKTLKYSIKREILVYTDEELKLEKMRERIGIKKKKYGIILGKINYLKKKCIVVSSEDSIEFVLPNGVLYKIKSVILIDLSTHQEMNRELFVLNEFFESFSNKMCFYVPFNLPKLVRNLQI